ncbi:MAG: sporulation protein [Desulfobulbaceae bacterium]|nr:sporulation protein [Desulfobulbaceae bacterium]
MSFFKRMLSSIGIGSAKVNTMLEGELFHPGETINGVVEIKGGNTPQQIDGLYFSILTSYTTTVQVEKTTEPEDGSEPEIEIIEEEVTKTHTLHSFKIDDNCSVEANETKQVTISFQLPWGTPLSQGTSKTWITTGLDIKKGLDSSDKDYIQVAASTLVQETLQAMDQLGFVLNEVDCEEAPAARQPDYPIIQEFEFKPNSSSFQGQLDEIELVFMPKENELEIYMEIDRKIRGISSFVVEMIGGDETQLRFSVTNDDIEGLNEKISNLITTRL